jgi:hypothetical protein
VDGKSVVHVRFPPRETMNAGISRKFLYLDRYFPVSRS